MRKEAGDKSQSIIQQAEDKAKQESERRTIEIIQQAEDKAKQEAEKIETIKADNKYDKRFLSTRRK